MAPTFKMFPFEVLSSPFIQKLCEESTHAGCGKPTFSCHVTQFKLTSPFLCRRPYASDCKLFC